MRLSQRSSLLKLSLVPGALLALWAASPVTAEDLIVDGTERWLYGERVYGRVEVIHGGTLHVSSHRSYTTEYGWLRLVADSVFVDSESAIVADGGGYQGQYEDDGDGPGGGEGGRNIRDGGGGGGHGGRGGRGAADADGQYDGAGGRAYGQAGSRDIELGSAGGAAGTADSDDYGGYGGSGGGMVWLEAESIVIEGTISANGVDGLIYVGDSAGGGAGGTILLDAPRLEVSGTLRADGGSGGSECGRPPCRLNNGGGGGGGGRIRFFSDSPIFSGTASVRGGAGSGTAEDGGEGTIFPKRPPSTTLQIFDGAYETESPALTYNAAKDEYVVLGHEQGELFARRVTGAPRLESGQRLSERAADRCAVSFNTRKKTSLVVWAKGGELWRARLKKNGKLSGSPGLLDSTAFAIREVDTVNIARTKDWLVAWTVDGAGGPDQLLLRRVLRNGRFAGTAFEVISDPRDFSIAYSPLSGLFLIVWTTASGEPGVFGQLFDRSGQLVGARLTIDSGEEASQPAVDFSPGADRFLVVWVNPSGRRGRVIQGRYLRGRDLEPTFVIATPENPVTSPAVAYSTKRRTYLVAWSEAGGKSRIRGAWLERDSLAAGDSFAISSPAAEAQNLNEEYVSCSSKRPHCLVTYWSVRGGSPSIWGTLLTPP